MSSDFFRKFQSARAIPLPAGAREITAIDMHTGGEPLRVVTGGYPTPPADSLIAFRRALKEKHDAVRTAIMFEPRGHADMYGCLLLPPFDPQADCSVIFMHNEGYSTMCGHAVIAIATLAATMGWIPMEGGEGRLAIEAPCGLIRARAVRDAQGGVKASFRCVPSFVAQRDAEVFVPSLGRKVTYDLAYGGAFYAYVDADALGVDMTPANNRRLIELGREIKREVAKASGAIRHPFEPDLGFLYGTIFTGRGHGPGADSRNVCVFADGEVDRSPTGSGVSGRMAIHHARGDLQVGQGMTIESIVGSRFFAKVAETCSYGPHAAVIPEVEGEAFICGENRFILDPRDPFNEGFFLR